jgi:hypothetical protein
MSIFFIFSMAFIIHHAAGFGCVLVRQQSRQHVGGDLPRQAEAILHPAALRFTAAIPGELAPEVIDLRLGLAMNLK